MKFILIAFSIGSEIFIESGLIIQEFSLTSKVETAYLGGFLYYVSETKEVSDTKEVFSSLKKFFL